MNAIGGVPLKTSVERGSSTWRANVSQHASRSRWKCTQPFGVPVVPDVKAMIATSSAAVSTGSNVPRSGRSSITRTSSTPTSPARSRATSASPTRAFAVTFSISRARRSGIVATTIPPASTMPSQHAIASGVFGECSSTRVPGSIANDAATADGTLAQLGVAPATGDRRPLVREQLDRRVHARGPVEQQQVGPRLARRQVVAGERVGHRSSSRAMISCWTSDAPS